MAKTKCELQNHIKTDKLRQFGHIMRNCKDTLELSVMMALVEGTRKRGRPKMSSMTSLWRAAFRDPAFYAQFRRENSRSHPLAQSTTRDDGFWYDLTWHDWLCYIPNLIQFVYYYSSLENLEPVSSVVQNLDCQWTRLIFTWSGFGVPLADALCITKWCYRSW